MLLLNWLDTLKGFLKTPQCVNCSLPLQEERAKFCAECRTSLGQRSERPLFMNKDVTLYSASDLKPALKRQLYGYKYHGMQNANWLADFWIDYWQKVPSRIHPENTLIVLIPSHVNAQDSARLSRIAQPFARAFGYGLSASLLRWQKACSSQHNLLNRRQRFENVSDAFAADLIALKRIQRVIILDDVTTTGATLLAAAQALREASQNQPLSVEALALTHIPFHSKPELNRPNHSQARVLIPH